MWTHLLMYKIFFVRLTVSSNFKPTSNISNLNRSGFKRCRHKNPTMRRQAVRQHHRTPLSMTTEPFLPGRRWSSLAFFVVVCSQAVMSAASYQFQYCSVSPQFAFTSGRRIIHHRSLSISSLQVSTIDVDVGSSEEDDNIRRRRRLMHRRQSNNNN